MTYSIIFALIAIATYTFVQGYVLPAPNADDTVEAPPLSKDMIGWLAEKESWHWESDSSWSWEGSGVSTKWLGTIYTICYDDNKDVWFPSSKTVGLPQWLEICATLLAMNDERYASIADAAAELEMAGDIRRAAREHKARERKFKGVREGRESNLSTTDERLDGRKKLTLEQRLAEAERMREARRDGQVV